MRAKITHVLASLVLALVSGAASATVIDFEELSFGQSISYDHYASQGILFDSGINWGIYDPSSSSPQKALINNTSFAGDLFGSFTSTVSDLSIKMGDWCCDADTGLLEAYDIDGNLLASDSGASNSWFTISVTTSDIASFRVFATGAVIYDEISFTASEVPTPSVFALLGLGLAGIGFSRKKKAA